MSKKDLELYWLEHARSIDSELFSGDIFSHESPDFVLLRDGVRHGVEVTRFVSESRHGEPIGEEQTGLRKKLLALAKKEFSAHCSTQLRVGAVFHTRPVLRAGRLPELARQIAAWLTAKLAGASDWTRATWNADDEDCLPPEIARLFATVIPSVANTHWYPAQAGWVSNAGLSAILRIVAPKERNIDRYREHCDELSLLIVFEGTPHSARAVHAPEVPVTFSVPTRFDRLLCLDVLEKRVVNLPVSVYTVQ